MRHGPDASGDEARDSAEDLVTGWWPENSYFYRFIVRYTLWYFNIAIANGHL